MSIRFACPACNAVMNAPDNKAGLKVSCLHCGQRLLVPGPPPGTVLARLLPLNEPMSIPKPARPPHPPSPPKSGYSAPPCAANAASTPPLKLVVACSSCQTPLTLPEGRHGVFQCPRCKNTIAVPEPMAPASQGTGRLPPSPSAPAPPPRLASAAPAPPQLPQPPAANRFGFIRSYLPQSRRLRIIALSAAAVIVLGCTGMAAWILGFGPQGGFGSGPSLTQEQRDRWEKVRHEGM